ncbi:hypothetical protein CALCODRAFT_246236 [Calocera cornea HHB12733]|uniref:Uncharacterized protein n=1 Tax=Calocera cornea HHB12733 TaxID=1353952 RepID=A0A165JUM8_9BASI|nr:hypothetical protein CALCODRAFT_246236 [Calocera cornea HHB12733]
MGGQLGSGHVRVLARKPGYRNLKSMSLAALKLIWSSAILLGCNPACSPSETLREGLRMKSRPDFGITNTLQVLGVRESSQKGRRHMYGFSPYSDQVRERDLLDWIITGERSRRGMCSPQSQSPWCHSDFKKHLSSITAQAPRHPLLPAPPILHLVSRSISFSSWPPCDCRHSKRFDAGLDRRAAQPGLKGLSLLPLPVWAAKINGNLNFRVVLTQRNVASSLCRTCMIS